MKARGEKRPQGEWSPLSPEVANACKATVVGVIDMKGEQGGDCLLPLLISRV